MKISDSQSHRRDSRHESGPPSGLPPPRPGCRKSPGAPLHSAEVRPRLPETQKQSHAKGKFWSQCKFTYPRRTLHHQSSPFPLRGVKKEKRKGKKFMNTPYSQVTCYNLFLTFPHVSYCSGWHSLLLNSLLGYYSSPFNSYRSLIFKKSLLFNLCLQFFLVDVMIFLREDAHIFIESQ